MLRRSLPRRRLAILYLELLEDRLVLAGGTLTIPLDPTIDQFGDQINTVQSYGTAGSASYYQDFGVFDTGASAVTFGPEDPELAGLLGESGNLPIPVKVPGGAAAQGIGGSITGDVSVPATIQADGMHAISLAFDDFGFPTFGGTFTANSAQAPNIRAFLGTPDGSPNLPTITGTPILVPGPGHPNGYAAFVDMQGYEVDFGDLFGDGTDFTLPMPDIHFVSPGVRLTGNAQTTDPVYVNTSFYGGDNHLNPGNDITEGFNPIVNGIQVATGSKSANQQSFLFDTGAQLSVISTATALSLGLDLNNPDTTITVSGVGGDEDIPGYTVDKIVVPRADGGQLVFTDVPVFVLDVGDGIDGILGMNLLNFASQVTYDPYKPGGPQLGFTFLLDRSSDLGNLGDLGGDGSGNFLNQLGVKLVNHGLPLHLRFLNSSERAPTGAVSDPALGQQLLAMQDAELGVPLADPLSLNTAPGARLDDPLFLNTSLASSHAQTPAALDQYFQMLPQHSNTITQSDPLHTKLRNDSSVFRDLDAIDPLLSHREDASAYLTDANPR